MMLLSTYHDTKITTIYNVAEKTGLSLGDLLRILKWDYQTLELNGGYLTSKELKYIATQYSKAIKNYQKRVNAKKDRMLNSELIGARRFLKRFVGWEFHLFGGDVLTAELDSAQIEMHFYNLIFGFYSKSESSEFQWINSELIFRKALSLKYSNYIPVFSFKSEQYYIYPDEEDGDLIYSKENRLPLCC